MPSLDLARPHVLIGRERDPDWVEQDGQLFAWSESNLRFEPAWWLTTMTDRARDLRAERPAPDPSAPRFPAEKFERTR